MLKDTNLSQATIARDCGLNRNTVSRILEEVESEGEGGHMHKIGM
jgi:hypothetical protein